MPNLFVRGRKGRSSQLAAGGDAHGPELLLGMGSDAPELLHRKRLENGWHRVLAYPPETIGFCKVAGQLGDEDIRPHAHRAGNSQLVFYRILDGPRQILGTAEEVV